MQQMWQNITVTRKEWICRCSSYNFPYMFENFTNKNEMWNQKFSFLGNSPQIEDFLAQLRTQQTYCVPLTPPPDDSALALPKLIQAQGTIVDIF